MNKLLTVVIPVYNTEKYLNKCLDSLIVPKYMEQLDIIVVIDGSKDNSSEIAHRYADKYPHTFRVIDKENGGHGSCCNVGLKEAQGKYLRFLDSDDWFDDTFEQYLDELNTTTADYVYTPIINEYVYNNTRCTDTKPLNRITFGIVYNVSDLTKKETDLFFLGHGTFTTRILRQNNLHFREKVSYDDTILSGTGCLDVSSILFLNYPIYHYLIGRPEQTVDARVRASKIDDYILQMEDLFSVYEENKSKLGNYAQLQFCSTISGHLNILFAWLTLLPTKKDYDVKRREVIAKLSHFPSYKHFARKRYCTRYVLPYSFFKFLRQAKRAIKGSR